MAARYHFSGRIRGTSPRVFVEGNPSLLAYRQYLANTLGGSPEQYNAFLHRFIVSALDDVEARFGDELSVHLDAIVETRGQIKALYDGLLSINPASLTGPGGNPAGLRHNRLQLEALFRDLESHIDALERLDPEQFVGATREEVVPDIAGLAEERSHAIDPETGETYVPRGESPRPREETISEPEPTLDLDDPLNPRLLERALDNEDLPDISHTFAYLEYDGPNGTRVKEVSGNLGVPGEVRTHRDTSAQSDVSAGTGDHAAHLIANIFGASGGVDNLSRFNAGINLSSYKRMENAWGRLLKDGGEVFVTVQDVFRPGDGDRPIYRVVQWTETAPNGASSFFELTFPNFHTRESRAAAGITPSAPVSPAPTPAAPPSGPAPGSSPPSTSSPGDSSPDSPSNVINLDDRRD